MANHVAAPTVIIYEDGQAVSSARALSLQLGSGANGMATLEYVRESFARDSGRTELVGMNLIEVEQPVVEVVIVGDKGERTFFCGNRLANHFSLNENGDTVRAIARVEDFHFGIPHATSGYWDSRNGQPLFVNLETVFNPELDGVVQPNCSQRVHPTLKYSLFIHPESAETATARAYANSPNPEFWTLPHAVFYLCQTLNSGQLAGGRKIQNPTLAELLDVLPNDESLLRNHEVPFGLYLPEILDEILSPFGFDWCIDVTGRGPQKRKIRVFARSAGKATTEIKLQPMGSTADSELSNFHSCSLTADASSGGFTSLSVFGEYERYEATFLLIPAWPDDLDLAWNGQDADGSAYLSKNSSFWQFTPALSRVWRDWVLNEGGDYIDVRNGVTQPYDFDYLFGRGKWIARRRRFLPCLSKEDDGHPRGHTYGVFVEWSADGGTTWNKLEEIGAVGRELIVFDRECGIRFNGDLPPDELQRAGGAARVRVTACVENDTRCKATNERGGSPLTLFKRQYLNVGSKFKKQKRDPSSIFNSYLSRFALADIERDDTGTIDKMAVELIDKFGTGLINGGITLTGVDHPKLRVGDTVPGIPGRKVGFGVDKFGSKFPSIVGLRFNFQNQTTDVVLGTYRGRAALAM